MKSSRITFAVISLLALIAIAPVALKFKFATALTEDPSSATTTDQSTTTADQPTSTAPTTEAELAASPSPLTLVHTAGTKYVDYCTDGTTITAYPGDPAVDANFDKPDAPTPKCPEGQNWDHTSALPGYDTPSGDLEIGDYAQ
jgi:hypothetical protein